ncbi:FHA domain-containing protein [Lacisediminihabitans changchengi]|uniref:FHA domain-containing protein n=1 Tax=Lacisediminihabitans changchengi TaxID=2787634 RepID=A0A934SN48_9MICO|nr:FHA domain-containing protein [Lacisediminihabitans changchengi]MBK4346820.1 FHA domain-containing protein [Lacisediminihabitans changchengi]MBK4348057.1 FHA domain-containing protein [Lacisediminihabitans changchengi]
MVATRFDIELEFSLEEAAGAADDGEPSKLLTGSITAHGSEVQIYASDPELLISGRAPKLTALRELATQMAELGVSVTLTGPAGYIAGMGDVKSSLVQRAMTGSPHIRLGAATAIAPLLRARPTASSISLPPSTPFPLVPTVSRRLRRRVTTTHYTPGSGRPRLIFVVGSEYWDGTPPREFELLPGVTTIGSDEKCDLRLDGLLPMHAEIRHDGNDEYVLYAHGPIASSAVRAVEGQGQILRTGARLELGDWRMAYFRAEFADHGRPFGGRVGGELARQKPQPERRVPKN